MNWVLFTNCPVKTIEQAKKCISWYQKRWGIEEFHKVMKSGCNAGKCYLQTFEKISKYVALMSVIAFRLYWLTLYGRVCPERPSSDVLESYELAALYVSLNKGEKPKNIPSVKEVILMIAKLGGFLAR